MWQELGIHITKVVLADVICIPCSTVSASHTEYLTSHAIEECKLYAQEGKPLVLEVVRKAQQMLVNDSSRNLEYLAIGGIPEFCKLSAELAFGKSSSVIQERRNVTVQSLSGTGSLRVSRVMPLSLFTL